jgi:hypothetical protein
VYLVAPQRHERAASPGGFWTSDIEQAEMFSGEGVARAFLKLFSCAWPNRWRRDVRVVVMDGTLMERYISDRTWRNPDMDKSQFWTNYGECLSLMVEVCEQFAQMTDGAATARDQLFHKGDFPDMNTDIAKVARMREYFADRIKTCNARARTAQR